MIQDKPEIELCDAEVPGDYVLTIAMVCGAGFEERSALTPAVYGASLHRLIHAIVFEVHELGAGRI